MASQRAEMCQQQSNEDFYFALGQVGTSPGNLPHSCCSSTHCRYFFGSGASQGCPGRQRTLSLLQPASPGQHGNCFQRGSMITSVPVTFLTFQLHADRIQDIVLPKQMTEFFNFENIFFIQFILIMVIPLSFLPRCSLPPHSSNSMTSFCLQKTNRSIIKQTSKPKQSKSNRGKNTKKRYKKPTHAETHPQAHTQNAEKSKIRTFHRQAREK